MNITKGVVQIVLEQRICTMMWCKTFKSNHHSNITNTNNAHTLMWYKTFKTFEP